MHNRGTEARGGLGIQALLGRKIYSKSGMRKNQEGTPTYLHGSWNIQGESRGFSAA
jgi:hypothetical protein